MNPLQDFGYLMPEWIVCGTILVLILNRFWGDPGRRENAVISTLGCVTALLFTVVNLYEARLVDGIEIGNGLLLVDSFSQTFKVVFLISTLAAVLYSAGSVEINEKRSMEFNVFLLGALTGMMFLASSLNLAMIYLSFEMLSLSSYVLAGFTKGDPRSVEAGYKYVLFGAVSSGIMLFGLSLLFGMTGTLNASELGRLITSKIYPHAHLLSMPILFVLVGIGYKIAFFPFHYWAPDVYEGSPTPVTAFFSVGTKAAGFALLLRVVFGTTGISMRPELANFSYLVAVLAALTMTVGNFAALNQSNIKRMLAYSAIAHAGYMLMGLTAMNAEGARAVLFYLFAYMFTNLGAFTVVIALFNVFQSEQVDELTGIGKLFPVAAVSMAVCLFSLTGLPPTAGFVGKFYLFQAVIDRGWYLLAFVAAVNTVVSLFYYMRILKAFYFKEPRAGALDAPCLGVGYNSLIVGLTVPVLFLGVFWSRLADQCLMSVTNMMIR